MWNELHTSQRQQRWTWRRRRGHWKSGLLLDRWSPQFLHKCQLYLWEREEDSKGSKFGLNNMLTNILQRKLHFLNSISYFDDYSQRYGGRGLNKAALCYDLHCTGQKKYTITHDTGLYSSLGEGTINIYSSSIDHAVVRDISGLQILLTVMEEWHPHGLTNLWPYSTIVSDAGN